MARRRIFNLEAKTSNLAFAWLWKPLVDISPIIPSIKAGSFHIGIRWGHTLVAFDTWLS